MKIGVICPADIAFRRFMPALQKCDGIQFAGVGVCSRAERFNEDFTDTEVIDAVLREEHNKAQAFADTYGGKIFEGYETIAKSDEIDALYIPLPPALHYKWAKIALEAGKHVLVEKPSTLSERDSTDLIDIARRKGLALHENYMFSFHNQLRDISDIISSGEIGNVRLYRLSFGFPLRAKNDFRYDKRLGGGALFDAGGYVLNYASQLLGETAEIKYAEMNYIDGYEVDMYGSGAMVNENGVTAQISYGMYNEYKCELEVWGSNGTLSTQRAFTAPTDFIPTATITKAGKSVIKELRTDDSFKKSIEYFMQCISDTQKREESCRKIKRQAAIVDSFRNLAKK